MGFVVICSEKIKSNAIPSSERVDAIFELSRSSGIRIIEPEEVDVEKFLEKVHDRDYIEKIKNHPFYDAAVENVKCIVKGLKALKEDDIILIPLTVTGHLAERNKMKGYCVFNTPALIIEELKDARVAVIELDAHHGKLISSKSVRIFCLGNRECKISEDLRCVKLRERGKECLEKFKEMIGRIKEFDPEIVVFYLGMDIDKREYAEIDIDREDLRSMLDSLKDLIKDKKTIILLASGSREDVMRDIFSDIVSLFHR